MIAKGRRLLLEARIMVGNMAMHTKPIQCREPSLVLIHRDSHDPLSCMAVLQRLMPPTLLSPGVAPGWASHF